MNYRSFNNLAQTIKNNLHKIPRNIDLIVGIPRSGLTPATIIGQFLNKQVVSVNSFLDEKIYDTGLYRKPKYEINKFENIRNVLVVDDSINSGASMDKYKKLIKDKFGYSLDIKYLAIYYVRSSIGLIDIGLEECPWPRIFQWNIMNSWVMENACVDIDGVLCVDPMDEENDDSINYINFLQKTPPLFIPNKIISALVTSRLEKYRPYTKSWLDANDVQYTALIMLDLPTREARIKANAYGNFKGDIFRSRKEEIFIESSLKQAIEISKVSHKLVFCVENMDMIYPQIITQKTTPVLPDNKQISLKSLQLEENMKVDICFFAHTSSLGGAERSLLDLLKILVNKGIICSVIMAGEGALKNACQDIGVIVKTVDSMYWWCDISTVPEGCFNGVWSTLREELSDIIQFVKSISPDAIYSQTIVNPFGAIVAEELNLPHFWALREYGEKDHALNFWFNYEASMNAMFNTSDYIFSISKDVAKIVVADNFQSEKIKVNYSHVDIPEKYKNKEYKLFCPGKIKIGVFGSIVDGKNQVDALNAVFLLLSQGYDVELYLVGHWQQDYYNSLMEIIQNTSFSDNIIFTGYSDKQIEIMNSMNIVISCSKLEALGRTLIEAILLKIPIIYSNTGGPQEVYKNKVHGLSYAVGNAQDLAIKIIDTIQNQEKTQKRVHEAYQYILNTFNEESYAKPIIEALKKVKSNFSMRKVNFVTKHIMATLPLKSVFQSKNIYFIQLFIDQGNSFSEENSIKLRRAQNAEFQEFTFDLIDKQNIKTLRLDPLNECCVIELGSLYVKKSACAIDLLPYVHSNAEIHHGKSLFFSTDDPQMHFNGLDESTFEGAQSLVVVLRYMHIAKDALHVCVKQKNQELLDKEQNIQSLNQELLDKEQNIQSLNQELLDIYTSKSWKITRPLRHFKRIIKG